MTVVDLAQAGWLLIAALGLALSVSYAGLPVLGQGAFVAVGAFGTALLGPGGEGWPLGIACATSILVAAVLGYAVAMGASRLEGASLALATWALAWLVHRALLANPDVTGGVDGLTRPAPAHLVSTTFGLDLTLTPTVHLVIAAVLSLVLMAALRRLANGPSGLDLAALREDPALAASLGIPVAARRRTVLSVTAALGALSGAGSAVLLGLVAPSDVSPTVSVQLFVAVLLGGTARWWGPLVGVVVITVLPHVADTVAEQADLDAGRSRAVLTAALLMAVLILRGPLDRWTHRPGPAPASPEPLLSKESSPGEVLLAARDITVRYDGLLALDDVSLELRAGEVHALVGPNGSGKSTLLKVLAGDLRAGTIDVCGHAVPADLQARVLAGVVRTPQQTILMPALTGDRQIAVAKRCGTREAYPVLRHLLATPSSRHPARSDALEQTGLTHIAGADPHRLEVGDQRLLQVARAVATGARVLLLDEPAAGMTSEERARLAVVLRSLAARGAAVLLVEHDMRLVGQVADRVTVLDVGRVLARGTPEEVRMDPAVRHAYLGA